MRFTVKNPAHTNRHNNDFFKVVDDIFGFGNDLAKFSNNLSNGFMNPPVNIIESDIEYTLQLSVPGWSKEDFDINVEGKFLTISAKLEETPAVEGETKETDTPTVEHTTKYIKHEFTAKKAFSRTFTLSKKANVDAIEASYENGILAIVIAKLEEAKPVKKVVEIS